MVSHVSGGELHGLREGDHRVPGGRAFAPERVHGYRDLGGELAGVWVLGVVVAELHGGGLHALELARVEHLGEEVLEALRGARCGGGVGKLGEDVSFAPTVSFSAAGSNTVPDGLNHAVHREGAVLGGRGDAVERRDAAREVGRRVLPVRGERVVGDLAAVHVHVYTYIRTTFMSGHTYTYTYTNSRAT